MMISLKKYNVIACILHSLCFIVLLILYLHYKNTRNKANIKLYRMQLSGQITTTVPPISPKTLSFCSTQGNVSINPGQCAVAPSFQQPKKVSHINAIFACMAFFLITALAHGLYASDINGFYSNAIKEGWNPYRWFEYAITASLMSAILGSIQGTGSVLTVAFMAGVTGAMQLSGFTVESIMKKSSVDLFMGVLKEGIIGSTLNAWILFVFLWFGNLYTFFTLVKDLKDKFKGVIDPQNNKEIRLPGFVYFIVFVQLLNYAFFGFVQFYQIYKNWNVTNSLQLFDFKRIEKYYLLLSFIAKLGLAGGVSYGLILRTKNCPKEDN